MPKIAASWTGKFRKFLLRLEGRFLRGGSRRLRLATSGRMYIFITIGVGLAALLSANNILYWIESLLLGGLIISGLISEQAVSGIQLQWKREQAFARESLSDRVMVTNKTRIPFFGLEIGEMIEAPYGLEFSPMLFVGSLGPFESKTVIPFAVYPERGLRTWQGIGIQTAFPFGLAQKLRLYDEPGERWIYPERKPEALGSRRREHRLPIEVKVDGSLRTLGPDEDHREVYWPKSLIGDRRFARPRSSDEEIARLMLDLDAPTPLDFERQLSQLTAVAWNHRHESRTHLEVYRGGRKIQTLSGTYRVLKCLAQIEFGKAWPT